jgi:hypothetical protein
MKILASRLAPTEIQTVCLALLVIGAVSTPSRADTGIVSAVVSKLLELAGTRVGVEFSIAMSGVTVRLP